MAIFQNLYVWQESAELAVSMIRLSDGLATRNHYALASQVVRASLSVPSNIAEGQGRSTTRDRRHFLIQARGSLYELETHLEILSRAGLWTMDESVQTRIRKISAGLTKIINRLG